MSEHNNTNNENNEVLTPEEQAQNLLKKELDYIEKMQALYCEISVLQDDLKVIKEDAKEDGLKPSKLAKIAKLKADAKLGSFVSDNKELLNYIENNL